MLTISAAVLQIITRDCKDAYSEQGWLVGCKMHTEYIDSCCMLVPTYTGDNCFVLNSATASQTIRQWAENGICAIGFIHSHLVDDEALSRADRDSAESLLRSLKLPFLYIGIVINEPQMNRTENLPLTMYKISSSSKQSCTIVPIHYAIDNSNYEGRSA